MKTKILHGKTPCRKALRQKTLRLESLEERQLLAVDLGLGGFGESGNVTTGVLESMRAVFPQPRSFYESTQSAYFLRFSTMQQNETALVPAKTFVAETTAESRSLAMVKVCERYLQERFGQSEFAGLTRNDSGAADVGTTDVFVGANSTSSTRGYTGTVGWLILSGGGPGNVVNVVSDNPKDPTLETTLFVFQNGNGQAYVSSMVDFSGNGVDIQMVKAGTGADASDYWIPTTFKMEPGIHTSVWQWTLPSGMANADAVRDFTFIASTDTNAKSFDIHVAYVEIAIQFAGKTELDDQNVEQPVFAPRTTTGGQTVDNTVVVGQKVHAKVETSSKVSVDINSIMWNHPYGGDVVRNYITNDNVGEVVKLTDVYYHPGGPSSYFNEDLEFYYTSNTPNKIGGLNATFNLVDDNGKFYYGLNASTSFYIEAPKGVSLSAARTSTNIYTNPTNAEDGLLILGDLVNPTNGMTFNATITAPSIPGIWSNIGAGEVNFLQTVATDMKRSDPGSTTQEIKSPDGKMELDTEFPYGDGKPDSNKTWTLDAGEPRKFSDPYDPLKTVDSPQIPLELNPKVDNVKRHYTTYEVDDSYVMYLMYRPNGNNENDNKGSIWIPLQQIAWTWKADASWVWSDYYSKLIWDTVSDPNAPSVPTSYTGTSVTSITDFPTWESNVKVRLKEDWQDIT